MQNFCQFEVDFQQSRPFESWIPGEALPTLRLGVLCLLMIL